MTSPFSRVFLLAFIAFLSATAAHGDLIITVGNVTLLPGETKPVDVLIRSSDGSDALQSYAIRLQLDTTGIGDLLQFAYPPTVPESTDPDYVFLGDSQGVFAGVSSTVTTNDTFDSGDARISVDGLTPLTTTNQLLGRVDVSALPGASGGVFNLKFDNALSSFFNADGSEPGFTFTNGAVTTVPEPYSFLLYAGGLAIMVTAHRVRRRARQ